MSEEQGQAQEQPTTEQTAQLLAGQMLGEPEKKKPEEPVAQTEQNEGSVQDEQQEAPTEEEIQLDLDAKMFEVEEMREGGVKEKVKYSAKELMSQRMMQADYQRKTAELAREREAVRELVKQQTEPVLKQYQEKLNTYEQMLWQAAAPELHGVNLDELAVKNPAEWARISQLGNRFTYAMQAIQQERQNLILAQQQQQQEAQQQLIQKSLAILKSDIPNWSEETYSQIRKGGVENYGYSMEEVNQVVDARAIKVLHDALKYRELQKAKPSVEKKVVNVPKVLKPGSTDKTDPNRESLNKAKAQLRKTGRTEDAVAVARHFFNDA